MQKQKMMLCVLLTIFLNSCRVITPARSVITERCSPVIEELPESYDRFTGYCVCHEYKIGDEIKRVSETYVKSLMYCNKAISFPNYSTELYPFLEEWRVFLLQQELNKK